MKGGEEHFRQKGKRNWQLGVIIPKRGENRVSEGKKEFPV